MAYHCETGLVQQQQSAFFYYINSSSWCAVVDFQKDANSNYCIGIPLLGLGNQIDNHSGSLHFAINSNPHGDHISQKVTKNK